MTDQEVIEEVVATLGIGLVQMATVCRPGDITAWRNDRSGTSRPSTHEMNLVKLLKRIIDEMGEDNGSVREWLMTEHPELDGQEPIYAIRAGLFQQVLATVQREDTSA